MRKINILLAAVLLISGFSFFTSCKKADAIIDQQLDSLKIGLVAYYPFNNSGADESGNGNNGYVYNITSVPDRNGKANFAYHFDGSTSYIVVPDNQSLRLANTDITLSTWIKLDAYGSSYGDNILTKHIVGSNNGWAWGITGYAYSPTGVVTYGPGGTSVLGTGSKVINVNQWHMVTSVYSLSKQQLTIYVDGALNTVSNNILSPSSTITADMYIGRDNPGVSANGYFVQGALDDLRIYNRALTAIEVQKLYILTY